MCTEFYLPASFAEGQNLLMAVVNRLRNGETAEQIIASGVDAQTVALAQSIK